MMTATEIGINAFKIFSVLYIAHKCYRYAYYHKNGEKVFAHLDFCRAVALVHTYVFLVYYIFIYL